LNHQSTEYVDPRLNYNGERSFLQMGYYGSFFTTHVDGITWQNWVKLTTPNFNTTSSAPSNNFHLFNLCGGYDFSKSTRLVLDAAVAHSSPNETFLTNATTPVVPVASADALVVNKTISFKLTDHLSTRWQLAAAYKFDERDNHTPVNTYQFSDNNQPVAALISFNGAVVAKNANANLLYSKRLHKFDLNADCQVAKGQFPMGGFEYQQTERGCEGRWINCVDAASTKENIFHLDYHNSVAETLSSRMDYEHSHRSVGDYNENAFLVRVPFANVRVLSGDLSLTRAGSGTSFIGGNYNNNPLAALGAPVGTIAAFHIGEQLDRGRHCRHWSYRWARRQSADIRA
jgi:hypothetical protein